jgi:hypothetical protein
MTSLLAMVVGQHTSTNIVLADKNSNWKYALTLIEI